MLFTFPSFSAFRWQSLGREIPMGEKKKKEKKIHLIWNNTIKKKKNKLSLSSENQSYCSNKPQISELCSSLLCFLQLPPPVNAEILRNMVFSKFHYVSFMSVYF